MSPTVLARYTSRPVHAHPQNVRLSAPRPPSAVNPTGRSIASVTVRRFARLDLVTYSRSTGKRRALRRRREFMTVSGFVMIVAGVALLMIFDFPPSPPTASITEPVHRPSTAAEP